MADVLILMQFQVEEGEPVYTREWNCVYEGAREYMPSKIKELVALIDASDNGKVVGVGVRGKWMYDWACVYYLDDTHLYGGV